LILLSGPLAQELGIHGGQGCLGPGFLANATIGRAVNLVFINTCRAIPGLADLACLSSQARFTYCFAEDPSLALWPTINAERYDSKTTTLLALKAEPPRDVMDLASTTGSSFLETLIDCCTNLGSNNAYLPGNLIVVLTPDHARLLSRDGYDKDRIRHFIHANTGRDPALLTQRGLVAIGTRGAIGEKRRFVTRSPQDVEVIVAGGKGGHSAVILPWALHSEAVIKPILLPNGKVPAKISDFRRA
jgi:hypothetical protein